MVTRVEELDLNSTKTELLMDDRVTIVTAIATNKKTNLKKLRVCLDLSSIESWLLSKMATRLEDFSLVIGMGKIEEEKVRTIFEAIAIGPGNLKTLYLGCRSNLHRLDADVLATAVNNLEGFHNDLPSFLTLHQAEMALNRVLHTTSLKKHCIWVSEDADAEYMDPLVREAEKRVPNLFIQKSSRTHFPSNADSESDQDHDYGYGTFRVKK